MKQNSAALTQAHSEAPDCRRFVGVAVGVGVGIRMLGVYCGTGLLFVAVAMSTNVVKQGPVL